jgi:hypothetical protein
MDRRRDPAPIEEEDRLATLLCDPPELREERGRQRIPAFATQVDHPYRRQRAVDSRPELEAVQTLPALRTGSRAAVDRDGALELGSLRGDEPRVVAGVRLLLVRGVVLLVDADDPELAHRSEDR